MKSLLKTLSSSLIILLLLATAAIAQDVPTYITYNGFKPIYLAFNKVALIFSDQRFRGLFYTIAVLGIFVSGARVLVGGVLSGRGIAKPSDGFTWFLPSVIGMALFISLVIPPAYLANNNPLPGKVMIDDPVIYKTAVIEGLPEMLVLVATTFNSIERGFVEIIETSSAPNSTLYSQAAGGADMNALRNAVIASHFDNPAIDQSLVAYVNDCFVFEAARPGSRISMSNAMNGGLFQELADARSAVLVTREYLSDANGGPTVATCTEAWNTIYAEMMDDNNLDKASTAFCGASLGLGESVDTPTGAASAATCPYDISAITAAYFGPSNAKDEKMFMREAATARTFLGVMAQDNPELITSALAAQETAATSFGMGIAANEWIPIVRGILTAILICLTPFLLLFIPTPIFPKILGGIIGFFLWLTIWGITDAITHSIYVDYAMEYMAGIQAQGLSLTQALQFPDTAAKMLSMLGMMRSASVMLATVIAGMLARFAGSHAAAMLAGSFMGQAQSAGAKAGGSAIETEKRNAEMSSFKMTAASHTMHGQGAYTFDDDISGKTGSMAASHFAAKHQFGNFAGGANQGVLQGEMNRDRVQGQGDHYVNGGGNLRFDARTQAQQTSGSTAAYAQNAAQHGRSVQGMSHELESYRLDQTMGSKQKMEQFFDKLGVNREEGFAAMQGSGLSVAVDKEMSAQTGLPVGKNTLTMGNDGSINYATSQRGADHQAYDVNKKTTDHRNVSKNAGTDINHVTHKGLQTGTLVEIPGSNGQTRLFGGHYTDVNTAKVASENGLRNEAFDGVTGTSLMSDTVGGDKAVYNENLQVRDGGFKDNSAFVTKGIGDMFGEEWGQGAAMAGNVLSTGANLVKGFLGFSGGVQAAGQTMGPHMSTMGTRMTPQINMNSTQMFRSTFSESALQRQWTNML